MTIDHPLLGLVTVAPMDASELNMVRDNWMRTSHWRRRAILEAIDAGKVYVARDDAGLALGWVCVVDGRLAHGLVKAGYRGNGIARVLYEASRCMREAVPDATRRVHKFLERVG